MDMAGTWIFNIESEVSDTMRQDTLPVLGTIVYGMLTLIFHTYHIFLLKVHSTPHPTTFML